MAFFRAKQGREQVSTTGIDERDNVVAGIKLNVTFLGSMLVPTPTGHGSNRTENAVDKIYQEKYKAFGYGLKKVCLEISTDDIKVFEQKSTKEVTQIAGFPIVDVTYCNTDLKHEKAFVFVVADGKQRSSFRAFVFHCDSAAKVRELLSRFKQAFTVKSDLIEATRLRSYSAPPNRSVTDKVLAYPQSSYEDDIKQEVTPEDAIITNTQRRQRSHTELPRGKNLISTYIPANGKGSTFSKDDHEIPMCKALRNDICEDEFTSLAEKRLRSFDEKGKPSSGESLLLLQSNTSQPNGKNLFMQSSTSKAENENLLHF
eukprot:gene4596-5199_t